MSLYKRGNIWWIDITHSGKRIQQTAGTSDRKLAQQYHDKFKAALWRKDKLDEEPQKTWKEAILRWFTEMQHKRSLRDDRWHVKWLHPYLGNLHLSEISKDVIEEVAQLRQKENVAPASVNRMLAFVRSVLRKAANEWEWIEKTPIVRMRKEENKRIRWLTQKEACVLLSHLPTHLAAMAAFSLATGLRQSNVKNLKWQDVNMSKHHALIHPDEAKANRAIPVPLNKDAMAILQQQLGTHSEYVFTYRGKIISQVSTRAWRKALKKAGISNFRWHDLRHTWASWHIQNGTSLHELQALGGWASLEMVMRYAHLSSEHLKHAAARVTMNNESEPGHS